MICGIYGIFNTVTGLVYVGSSASMVRRIAMHRSQLNRNIHHSPYLQHAYTKYGAENFVWTIIEECGEEHLQAREQFWIDTFQSATQTSGYNLCPAAGSIRGLKLGPHSEEHRRKIGEAQRGKVISAEQRAAMSKRFKGRVMDAAWCAKIAASMTGKKFGQLSAEHKARISAVHKGKKLSDEQKQLLSRIHTGRPQSEETRAKRSASITAWHAARRAAKASMGAA